MGYEYSIFLTVICLDAVMFLSLFMGSFGALDIYLTKTTITIIILTICNFYTMAQYYYTTTIEFDLYWLNFSILVFNYSRVIGQRKNQHSYTTIVISRRVLLSYY
jgi:hypothetical protein